MTDVLEIERSAHRWTFTLNRPDKMNALNAELVEALLQGVGDAHASGTRLLVFQGVGRNFSAGFDQGELDSQSDADLLLRLVRVETLLHLVASSPCLTLAFAHGLNFGAGVDLFATCRHRYSSPDANFRMPGLRFGLVLGTRRFGDVVGYAKAREILEQTRQINASEALDIGLVTKLVESDARVAAVADALRVATLLDPATQQHLYRVLDSERADQDLADLVRSASRPGLKVRILNYLRER
ncbi:enoyl-CoA hydratase/carnithine racemase [Paraburkholderia sp. BL6665CI2N2]|uniref:enoyl-CoA hydratase/isomerase family protein n=1 Tax=Paraburkholderia sp. BL6665CI2N2 TaxID=1938806 RepID=UPI0010669557|nr:enoyl-CoA hydratase/isomerase family protein [Paraburkholderia sp. BL6665CI2N2]TDY15491.1 enoyl-CoA hydratase/carnithine racemase [Paraburkholderia sp. BL6665CI2N2]